MSWPAGYLDKPMTHCVHFVRTGPSGLVKADIDAAKAAGVKFGYWNYFDGGRDAHSIASPLACALELEHAPYGPLPWVEFLDDLITLAYQHDGLAIVVDRADHLVSERLGELFECVEAFCTNFIIGTTRRSPATSSFKWWKIRR